MDLFLLLFSALIGVIFTIWGVLRTVKFVIGIGAPSGSREGSYIKKEQFCDILIWVIGVVALAYFVLFAPFSPFRFW